MTADPYADQEIDTTGWDLNALAEHIRTVRMDQAARNPRPLTADEIEALTHPVLGLCEGWETVEAWTMDGTVVRAVERLGAVVDEAIFQRDLNSAVRKLCSRDAPALTEAESRAFDDYLRDM